MAKLNKSEAIEAAKNMAHRNITANGVRVEQLNSMTYEERKAEAERIYVESAAPRIDTHQQYLAAAHEAFTNAVLGIWESKRKAFETARRHFQTVAAGLSTTDAYKKINDIVKAFNIRGISPSSSEYRSTVQVERAWGVGATVYFSYDRSSDALVNPDDSNQRVYTYSLKVEISWSGTSRSLAEATASIALYRELTEMAAEVEAIMQRERVVYRYGFPEPTAVEPSTEPATSL